MSIRPLPHSTSLAAHTSIKPSVDGLRSVVLEIIQAAGAYGCTMDDVVERFPKEYHRPGGTLSSRFSELERMGLLVRNGDTRKGTSGRQQLVMRSAEFGTASARHSRKRAAFLAGMMYAAKILAKSDSLDAAKGQIRTALIKTAARTTISA